MYASDLTDAQWAKLEPLLKPPRLDRHGGGRPRKYELRRIVDAMLYVVKTGDSDDETSQVMQPRPNVLIELGMALSVYRHQTIIVQVGRIRRIADLAGFNIIHFDGSDTAIGKIVERLKVAGCAVDDMGTDWRRTRRFLGLDAYTRQSRAES